MAGPLEALGVVSGVLGIISFFESNIPSGGHENKGPTVSIKVAEDLKHEYGFEGGIDAVYAWNSQNVYLGAADGKNVKQSEKAEFTIDSDYEDVIGYYTGVAFGDNAVCVAWISVDQYGSDVGKGAWTGDIGYLCGQEWYEQQAIAGTFKDGGEYKPKCTWFDGDHTDGTPIASLKFKTMAYGKNVKETLEGDLACSKTVFGEDDSPIDATPSKHRRAPRQRYSWMEDKLVVSNSTHHRAETLCNSDTSFGPDFVGTDGNFCDMGTKTLTPLCSTRNVDGCITVDDEGKRVTKRSIGFKRTADNSHRSYKTIDNW